MKKEWGLERMTEGGRQGEREWEDGRVQVVMLHDLAAKGGPGFGNAI